MSNNSDPNSEGKSAHVTVTTSVIHNPGQTAAVSGAGQTVVVNTKTNSASGQVPNGPVFVNPA